MKRKTATAVREAAGTMGITDGASLNEIRRRYHELMKEYHPDVAKCDAGSSHRAAVEINRAYELLVDFCTNYRFSFRIEDLEAAIPKNSTEYWMERFGDDPIWG